MARKELKRGRIFARRSFVLAGLKAAMMAALAGRLFYLQVSLSDQYKTLSDSNRIKLFLIPPVRGVIVDRFGQPLASNKIHYRILLDPTEAKNAEATFLKLSDILNIQAAKKEFLLARIRKHQGRRPILLHEHLTWDEVALAEVNTPDLPGVYVEAGQMRYYPKADICSHAIGYVAAVSEQEAIKDDPLLNHPDFKIGKSGIEKAFEDGLRGEAGVRRMEVNAHGLTVQELSRVNSTPGKTMPITLDLRLQEFVTQRLLAHRSATSVVLDAFTGGVLAYGSVPAFDPNNFVEGISSAYWSTLTKNPDLPLVNKPIAQMYPPGSTFKPIVALAALMQGVNPEDSVYCPGYFDLGRRRVRCWREGGHGVVNMRGAIMHSCNVFFFHMGRRIGIDPITAMANQFGLGVPSGIEIPGEKSGLIPSPAWKKGRHGIEWQLGDTINTAIGQGFVLSTAMQLALMAARIASRGKIIKPHFELNPEMELSPTWAQMDIPQRYFDVVIDGMRNVMNTPGGTAYGSRILNPRWAMAGKTGTAQVISKKRLAGDYASARLWENQNHGLFIGFAPLDNPRYAISVIVDHGGSGSGAAAPIARDIMTKAQELESARYVMPSQHPASTDIPGISVETITKKETEKAE